MSSYYQDLDRNHCNYDLIPIPGIPRMLFRGPKIDPARPYIACIGAAQTFGRFCVRPFPHILMDSLGAQVLNLGVGGVGPRFFNQSHYLEWLNSAELVIVQVLSGRSEGNSLFDNSETRGLLGVRLTDNKQMRFEDFLGDIIGKDSPELLRRVIRETRANYVRNSIALLNQIHTPKILFWFSNRKPDYHEDFSSVWGVLGQFPQLVNEATLEELRAHADIYVECVSTRGIPQVLWDATECIDGTSLEDGKLVNRYYPSPEMHEEAALALEPVCRSSQ